jgi:hypothetical protein
MASHSSYLSILLLAFTVFVPVLATNPIKHFIISLIRRYLTRRTITRRTLTRRTLTRRTLAEHVYLVNCEAESGSARKYQIAYYSGPPNGTPEAIATVNVEPTRTAVWEGAPVSALFGDGNKFTANIPTAEIPERAYAGTGKNDYRPFNC